MEIKVREIRKVKAEKGNLRAMVDIEIAGLIVRGLRVMNGDKGAWLAWPSKEWAGRDGQPHYTNIVEPISSQLREGIAAEVLRAWGEQCG